MHEMFPHYAAYLQAEENEKFDPKRKRISEKDNEIINLLLKDARTAFSAHPVR